MYTNYLACPECGSTAQTKLKKTEMPFTNKICAQYECGCGCHFTAVYKVCEVYVSVKGGE